MAFKSLIVICAQAMLIKMAAAQAFYPSNTVSGNSYVDNNIVIGGLGGGSLLGGGSSLLGGGSSLAGSGSSLFGSGSSLFGSGGSLVGSGSSLVGSGSSLVGSSGFSSGSGAISNAVLAGLGGYNVISSGPLTVTTISPIGPSGLAVASENAIEGILTVNGQLPYLSAVAFEGSVPTSGSGVATCGCGSGNVAIVSEGFPAGLGNAGLGLGNAGFGLGAGRSLAGGLGGRNILY